MQTYISILRGINVSGHKSIRMEALRKSYEGLGCSAVRSYIQSGNVIFQHKTAKPRDLEKKIGDMIKEEYGFDVPVLVRTLEEFEHVLKNNPFVNKRKEDQSKLHVTFLSAEAEHALLDLIKQGPYDDDEYIVQGNTVYLFCPNGYGNTKLNNVFFEKKLKVAATTRNWKTIGELLRIGKE